MTIFEQHIPKGVKRTGKALAASYLTIHSTGNPTSTAQNERSWLTNPSNMTSTGWHVVVDEREAIEAIPTNEVAYHAGTSAGNSTSVGIEICESGDRERTLKNAAAVSAALLIRLGLGPDKLRQHYDWSGKNCPRILRDTGRWGEFCTMVSEEYKKQSDVPAEMDNTPDAYAKAAVDAAVAQGLLKGDASGNLMLHSPVTRQDMLVILERAGVLKA